MNLFWAGDQGISWDRNDGIKSVVTILGHMGISGYAHSHSEIGGYTSTFVIPNAQNPRGAIGRTQELLGRWGELGAVSSAVFRTHEGNIPQINAQSYTNSSTLTWFSYNARLFKALAPYRRYVLDNESAVKGWPLLRLPVLLHPQDKRAREIGFESFYLGSDLYVAPVLDAGISKLRVYLPGSSVDAYTHVWSDVTFQGGSTVTVDAPFGKPALFLVNHTTRPELQGLMDFVGRERNTTIIIS
jgi:alpha-glucosidase (family GH31 glycosyl hydrolase)